MRLSLLGKSEAIPTKSHQYDCLNMSQARTTTGMLKWTEERIADNSEMLRMEGIIFPGEDYTNWLCNIK